MNCRHCKSALDIVFLDLGSAPPSNAFLKSEALLAPETWYPLRLLVCESCWLVQTDDYAKRDELFGADYAYFSSTSRSWVEHARDYVETMCARFGLNEASRVVEVAANDGYLLQFVHERGISCLGVEPTHNTADAARSIGIEIVEAFFGEKVAETIASTQGRADLIVANNVLAHVPDINDFVSGFQALLADDGVATFEFPHLLQLVRGAQFDTVYHEHYSYLSLTAVRRIFERSGLSIFDVDELPTHGGSLRVYAQRAESGVHPLSHAVQSVLATERAAGMETVGFYRGFQKVAEGVKDGLLRFLLDAKRDGKAVAGYGAAAKGNTLLNYAGVRPDLLPYVCDAAASKQGLFMPGSHIPVEPPEALISRRPDYVFILPWNIAPEIETRLFEHGFRSNQLFVAVPRLSVLGGSS